MIKWRKWNRWNLKTRSVWLRFELYLVVIYVINFIIRYPLVGLIFLMADSLDFWPHFFFFLFLFLEKWSYNFCFKKMILMENVLVLFISLSVSLLKWKLILLRRQATLEYPFVFYWRCKTLFENPNSWLTLTLCNNG